jgi:hypothetical protein
LAEFLGSALQVAVDIVGKITNQNIWHAFIMLSPCGFGDKAEGLVHATTVRTVREILRDRLVSRACLAARCRSARTEGSGGQDGVDLTHGGG